MKRILFFILLLTLMGCKKENNKTYLPNITNYVQNSILFNTNLEYDSITDWDGNKYKTIKIGNQTWMAENLKVTHFCNGDAILNITNDLDWDTLLIGSYRWYKNDSTSYKGIYGALYNWYAVNDPRKIAPLGWHVPTVSEWAELINYLGGQSSGSNKYSGSDKLKEVVSTHWQYRPSWQGIATNETGFTALPGGYTISFGEFDYLGIYGAWWSNTEEFILNESYCMFIYYANDWIIKSNNPKTCGHSVRCIKD